MMRRININLNQNVHQHRQQQNHHDGREKPVISFISFAHAGVPETVLLVFQDMQYTNNPINGTHASMWWKYEIMTALKMP